MQPLFPFMFPISSSSFTLASIYLITKIIRPGACSQGKARAISSQLEGAEAFRWEVLKLYDSVEYSTQVITLPGLTRGGKTQDQLIVWTRFTEGSKAYMI